MNLKKRAKTISFGALFNIPSINMDRTLVIRYQFLLFLFLVRRYIRRKVNKKSGSFGFALRLEKGASTDSIILCLLR